MNVKLSNRTKTFYGIADLGISMLTASIQFFLLQYVTVDTYDDNTAIVFGKTYSSRVPIPTTDAGNLMQGWNTALGTILNDFLSDLRLNVKPAAAN